MVKFTDLFWSFFKIGLFTFGGGYAMIPVIQNEVITRHHWIEKHEFLDLLTIAQSAPGPISLNTSVFVGYKMRGYTGAAAALLGVILPSFVIILIVAAFFSQIRHNAVVDAAFKGMRPAVVALIIAPILGFTKGLHWTMTVIAATVAVAIWYFGFSPIYTLLAGASAGLIWAAYSARRAHNTSADSDKAKGGDKVSADNKQTKHNDDIISADNDKTDNSATDQKEEQR